MKQDFGVFTFSSSPPRRLTYQTHHSRSTPHTSSRSGSTLSPVVEASNEEADGRAIGANSTAKSVPIIVTSIPPSETFLNLTRGGVFSSDDEYKDVFGIPDNASASKFLVEDNLETELFLFTGTEGDVSGDNIPKDARHEDEPDITCSNHDHEQFPASDSPVSEKISFPIFLEDETCRAAILAARPPSPPRTVANPRSSLTRPKTSSLSLHGGKNQLFQRASVNGRNQPGIGLEAAAYHSVEQAVHRDRVNSLLNPSTNKPVLRKLSRPATTQPASRKINLLSENPDNGAKYQDRRKAGKTLHPSTGQTATSVQKVASQSNRLFTPRAGYSASSRHLNNMNRKISPPSQILKPQDPKTASNYLRRRKSLPDINANSSIEIPKSVPKGPASEGPKPPNRPIPPRRKISEPCMPLAGSPGSAAPSDRSQGGVFADPRYNPLIVAPKKNTALESLPQKYAEKWKHHVDRCNLAELASAPNIEPRATISNFEEEYEKIKNCRYIRRANNEEDRDGRSVYIGTD